MARISAPSFAEVDKDFGYDSNMCWECSSCAALWASNWANTSIHYDIPQLPGMTEETTRRYFSSPTDVHAYSEQYINNNGGLGYWHMLWFLSGSLAEPGMIRQEGGGGFYGLTPKEAMSYIYNVPPEGIMQIMQNWEWYENWDGITASIYWGGTAAEPSDPEITLRGGHEVPVWGYERDEVSPALFAHYGYAPDPVSVDDPIRFSGIQISDPDDQIAGRRFWLRAFYYGNSHLYRLMPDPDDSNVPDNWKNKASMWLYGITLIRKKPTNLLPSYNLE